MDPKNRCEQCPEVIQTTESRWRIAAAASIAVVGCVLVYCAWRIVITTNYLQEHRAYIKARDARWDPFLTALQAHMNKHDDASERIDAHLNKQDGESRIRQKNQEMILGHQAEILKYEKELLDRLKTR